MAPNEPTFVEVNGARIHYELAGEGDPVVFVHGFACDLTMWEPQIPEFSRRFRTLRYDARGFGRSSVPGSEPYGHYHDLAALIEHFDLAPAHVIGLSRGGSIVLNFALTYPKLLRKLVLAGASPGPTQAHKVHDSGPNEGYRQLLDVAREQGIGAAKALYAQSGIFAAAQTNPYALAMVHRMLDDYSGWHLVNDDPHIEPEPAAHERLNEIEAPTLAIVGGRDVELFHTLAGMVEQNAPNGRKAVIPGVGHMVNAEAPDAFNRLVLDFLQE